MDTSRPTTLDLFDESSNPRDESSLDAVDWEFAHRASRIDLEDIHPYPAKFIGDLPRALIQRLPIPHSSLVLDPFCGSGTTLVEAQRAGLGAVGIDLNPIACLISRVKTSTLHPGLSEAADEVARRAESTSDVRVPDLPNLDHWFNSDVQQTVSSITHVLESPAYTDWHDQLRLALSSILVRVSNQESDTRYAAIDKSVTSNDVLVAFVAAARKLERALLKRDWTLEQARVIEGNTLDVDASSLPGPIGLIITSPPYPNAYEYWLYHKYRMWWLGFDPIQVKRNEIGARAHFFKKNHHTAETFGVQMRKAFALIDGVLVDKGYVCIVVGRSRIHGEVVDNAATLEKIALEHSFTTAGRYERTINATRKSFNLSHANIKTESILIFQKT